MWGNISLQCPEGTKVRNTQNAQEIIILLFQISIQSVQYGSPNQSCTIQSSLRRVEAECQSQANCFLSVTPQNLIAETEDPCPLSKKKVEISFQCKPASFRSSLNCPGETLSIACGSPNERLLILASRFSRISSGPIHCPLERENVTKENFDDLTNRKQVLICEKTSVTETIVRSCSGHSFCDVNTNSASLGVKEYEALHVYLKTIYACCLLYTSDAADE